MWQIQFKYGETSSRTICGFSSFLGCLEYLQKDENILGPFGEAPESITIMNVG